MLKGKRVAIVGAGNVGATVAYTLAMQGICHEIILKDAFSNLAIGKSIDINHATSALNSHSIVKAAVNPEDMKDCDVIVITAGSPRLPGMSRDDLLLKNAGIMREVVKEIKEVSPEAIIIVVSNPLDAMVYVALKESGFEKERVIGMAGVLDSARMATLIQRKLGYASGQIRAAVMGGHGDDMVPLTRLSSVAGVPLHEVMSQEDINEIVEQTKYAGAEIVKYLERGSAYYAPAQSVVVMVDAILKDTKQIHPCAILLDGEYGYKDVVSGVPVMLGAEGAEKIVEFKLLEEEKALFSKSVNSVSALIATLNNQNFFS